MPAEQREEGEPQEDAPLVALPPPGAPAAQPPVLAEVLDLTRLAAPIFISRISSTLKNVTDTAILGHIDADSRFLLASALADMWMQSTGCMMNGRVLSVFCGQAFGAGNKPMAGIWLQVSLSVLAAVALPVLLLWLCTEQVLLALGQPPLLSADAGYYARVFALAIPARIVFGQVPSPLPSPPPSPPPLPRADFERTCGVYRS
jgi:MATE family multidrug resistance protein